MARNVESLAIPELSWFDVRSRLLRLWRIVENPHHSIIGQTGSGKSYLTRYGILDTCRRDRVLFIDGKGDDKTLAGLGHVVNRFPTKALRAYRQHQSDDPDMRQWYRLVTSANWATAQRQVAEALDMVMAEGDWVVVIDELRYITDTNRKIDGQLSGPGLSMRGPWEAIVLRGRSRGVGLVNLTQEPVWVPSSFYTQSQFYWISRIEDERAMQRIAEIGASRALMDHLPTMKRRYWIYTDSLEDERFWALTQVPARTRNSANSRNVR